MIESSNFKKKLSSIFHKKERFLFDKDIMHPERDWFLLVFSGVIFLFLGAFWSVTTYSQFSNVPVINAGGVVEGVGYQAGLVALSLEELEARTKKYNDLKNAILVGIIFESERQTSPGQINQNEENLNEVTENETDVTGTEASPQAPEENNVLILEFF